AGRVAVEQDPDTTTERVTDQMHPFEGELVEDGDDVCHHHWVVDGVERGRRIGSAVSAQVDAEATEPRLQPGDQGFEDTGAEAVRMKEQHVRSSTAPVEAADRSTVAHDAERPRHVQDRSGPLVAARSAERGLPQ